MARKRMIDPCIWTDDGFIHLSLPARLLFIGLITNADDEGRGQGAAPSLKAMVFPSDEISLNDIENLKDEVAFRMRVVFYESGGRKYYQLCRWHNHQYIQSPKASLIPKSPNGDEEENPTFQQRLNYQRPRKKTAIPFKSRQKLALRYGVNEIQTTGEGFCQYCGEKSTITRKGAWVHFGELEIDHVIPESKGGTHDPLNLVLACKKCNIKKKDKILDGENTLLPTPNTIQDNTIQDNVSGKKPGANPAIKRLIDHYHDQYILKADQKPTVTGQWGRNLKLLLRAHTEETVQRVMDYFFDYPKRTQFGWGKFMTAFDNLLPGATGHTPQAGPKGWKCPKCGAENRHTGGYCLSCRYEPGGEHEN